MLIVVDFTGEFNPPGCYRYARAHTVVSDNLMPLDHAIVIVGRLMLAPAHAGHLPTLRALIRESASEGSFDRELATNSPESQLFFANLRQALLTGYFVVEDARGVIAR